MNHLISMFIDNELKLKEKVEFVEQIRKDGEFYEESVALLDQEQMIKSEMDLALPTLQFEKKRSRFRLPSLPALPTIRPFAVLSSAGAMAVMVVLLLLNLHTSPASAGPYRFVIYQPEAGRLYFLNDPGLVAAYVPHNPLRADTRAAPAVINDFQGYTLTIE